ncbi:IclR family transcriptional regulator [Buttiauxella sp. B2]|uniref:IclR family transcriptional regulator n=1 Tax=Buttiauxella sp. B2 TaxID=2587812 RepID=UPI00167B65E9|nr:IclR family transcriptional regulator C-terminal domain-containing protein [Buttiauxella sp. B2]
MTNVLQSTGVVFSLLNYFTLQKPAWGVRELAREINRSPSVIQRAINVLEQEGFLQKNAISRNYQLGFRCIELGQLANATLSFSEMAEQCLRPIVEESGETVFIYRRRDDFSVCSFILESPGHIRFTATVGERIYLHQAPFTQITLALMPEDQQEAYFERHLLHSDDALKSTLTAWKKKGYSNSSEAWQPHTQGISVPLFNLREEAVGSLCIAASSQRGELIEYKDLLLSAANKLKNIM